MVSELTMAEQQLLAFLHWRAAEDDDVDRDPDRAAFRFRSFTALVLEFGRLFTPTFERSTAPPATGAVDLVAREHADEHGLVYVEGVARHEVHGEVQVGQRYAWCTSSGHTAAAVAIDPVWRELGTAYIGLAVTDAYCRADRPVTARWPLLTPHPRGKELLRHGPPPGMLLGLGRPLPR